ncbi:MAG TPA: hemin uptake protein HemP [Burkholderiales bacterium]|nr:hemin uptake protein HemP [Burkholderiales bacterium]
MSPSQPLKADKPAPTGSGPRRIPVESLLGRGREVVIVHAGREYRLRLTQNGKLILTA